MTLDAIKETLIEGQRLSMQGSYDRRVPAKKAIPFLLKARKGFGLCKVKQNRSSCLAFVVASQGMLAQF